MQVQALVQEYTDAAVSKTINLSAEIDFAAFRALYDRAHDLGCKDCTCTDPPRCSAMAAGRSPSRWRRRCARRSICWPLPMRDVVDGGGRRGQPSSDVL